MALKSFNQFAKTFFLCKILFKKFVDIAYSRYACTAGLHFVLPSYLPYLSTCATKYLLVACVKIVPSVISDFTALMRFINNAIF